MYKTAFLCANENIDFYQLNIAQILSIRQDSKQWHMSSVWFAALEFHKRVPCFDLITSNIITSWKKESLLY